MSKRRRGKKSTEGKKDRSSRRRLLGMLAYRSKLGSGLSRLPKKSSEGEDQDASPGLVTGTAPRPREPTGRQLAAPGQVGAGSVVN